MRSGLSNFLVVSFPDLWRVNFLCLGFTLDAVGFTF